MCVGHFVTNACYVMGEPKYVYRVRVVSKVIPRFQLVATGAPSFLLWDVLQNIYLEELSCLCLLPYSRSGITYAHHSI